MLCRFFAISCLLWMILGARVARAQDGARGQRGAIQVGLRVGYGVPLGHTGHTATDTQDHTLSSTIKGQIPLGVDAGYLFDSTLYLGLSFQYGLGFVGSDSLNVGCDQPRISCSTNDIRLGVNVQYHLRPLASFDPWLGIGAGYEWLGISFETASGSASGTLSGFEFANFQGGGDFEVAPNLRLGPFVSFSIGQYGSASVSGTGRTASEDFAHKSLHEWLLLGVRGVYNFPL
jgi:outer membrane protein W